jgi:hypothetical protein
MTLAIYNSKPQFALEEAEQILMENNRNLKRLIAVDLKIIDFQFDKFINT